MNASILGYILANQIKHLGIIIDGNRRYSKKTKLPFKEVYKIGANKVYDVIRFVFEKTDIQELSIYALSYDNLLRKSPELDAILKTQKEEFYKWAEDPFFSENGIRVRFIGELNTLPTDILKSCILVMDKTLKNNKKTLNILMAYFGSMEIARAVERILRRKNFYSDREHENMRNLIQQSLEVKKSVDLIIRTGGGSRLSGFLPWQSEYAEIYVTKKLWPEIEESDIEEAINHYNELEVKKGR